MNLRKGRLSKKCIVLAICLTMGFKSLGQDIAFSQFYHSPFFTNPAFLGTETHSRLFLHYRNQPIATGEGFNTGQLSFVRPFLSKEAMKPRGGLGIAIMGDNASSFLNTFGLNLGGAYNLSFGKAQHISLGLQAGFYQRSLNIGEITTDAQFQTGVFNSEADIGENFENTSVSFLATSGGLLWYLEDAFQKQKAFLGLAYNNFNRPNLAFFESTSTELPANWTLLGGWRIVDQRNIAITPNFRWIRRLGFSYTNIGAWFTYKLPSQADQKVIAEGNLKIGAWYNTNRLAVMSLEFNQPKYFINFSYDIPAGSNSNAWLGSGAVEIIFGLKFSRKQKVKKPVNEPIEDSLFVATIDTISSNTLNLSPDDSIDVDVSLPENFMGIQDPIKKNQTSEENLDKEPVVKEEPIVINDYQRILSAEERRMFNYHIRFGFSSNNYPTKYLKLMDRIAEILKNNNQLKLEIVGHTCDIGSAEKNRQLSLKRANSIKAMMVQRGVNPQRILTKGLGQAYPLVPNSDEDNRKKNRRVEFKVYYE